MTVSMTYSGENERVTLQEPLGINIYSDEDDDNNDFDYEHVTGIENDLNDNFEQIRTYDYTALYRLDRDFPPITVLN